MQGRIGLALDKLQNHEPEGMVFGAQRHKPPGQLEFSGRGVSGQTDLAGFPAEAGDQFGVKVRKT